MKKTVSLLYLLCFVAFATAQELPSKYAIGLSSNLGLNWATYTERGPNEMTQLPGATIQLGIGPVINLDENWRVFAEGLTFLDIYNFNYRSELSNSNIDLTLYNLNLRAQAGFGRTIPMKKNDMSRFQVNVMGGMSFFQPANINYDLFSDDGQSIAVANSLDNPYLALEIGLRKQFNKNAMELAVTYHRHLKDNPSVNLIFFTPEGRSDLQSVGNYVGLSMRYQLGLNEHKVEKEVFSLYESKEFADRKTDVWKESEFKQRRVKMTIRDNANLDGDTISIALNGAWILKDIPVLKEKQAFILHLNEGENTLEIFANNLGRIPPNTSEIHLISGFRREKISTSSSLSRNEQIKIYVN